MEREKIHLCCIVFRKDGSRWVKDVPGVSRISMVLLRQRNKLATFQEGATNNSVHLSEHVYSDDKAIFS